MTFLSNSKLRAMFLIIISLLILDSFFLTPFLLKNRGGYEANPIHHYGFAKFGMSYPYFMIPFEFVFAFLVFNTGQKIIDWECKRKNQKDKNYIGKAMFAIIIIQIIVILNNLSQI